MGCTAKAATTLNRGRKKMKKEYETTTKTTVTLTVEEFLSGLNIKESGKLEAVIVTPPVTHYNAFDVNTVDPAKVHIHFKTVENRELEK